MSWFKRMSWFKSKEEKFDESLAELASLPRQVRDGAAKNLGFDSYEDLMRSKEAHDKLAQEDPEKLEKLEGLHKGIQKLVKKTEDQWGAQRGERNEIPKKVVGENSRLLLEALVVDDLEKVKSLIDDGADVNVRDKKTGLTPLLISSISGKPSIVELLLASSEVDVNFTCHGLPPLHYAIRGGHSEVAKLLIPKIVDVNAKTDEGDTPLHEAASHGQAGIAELLLSKGGEIEARNKLGGTPLHNAAFAGQLEVVNILLSNGASVNATDNSGYVTPLVFASMEGHTAVADLLRRHGGKEDLE